MISVNVEIIEAIVVISAILIGIVLVNLHFASRARRSAELAINEVLKEILAPPEYEHRIDTKGNRALSSICTYYTHTFTCYLYVPIFDISETRASVITRTATNDLIDYVECHITAKINLFRNNGRDVEYIEKRLVLLITSLNSQKLPCRNRLDRIM